MREDLAHHGRVLHGCDELQSAATAWAGEHIEIEHGFDLSVFEQKVSRRTKLIIINSPQNPTGAVLELEQLGRIAEIAARYRIPVLADEIYKSFLYEGEFASITRFPGISPQS